MSYGRRAKIVAALGWVAWLLMLLPPAARAGPQAVGVIQYNVKGGQGGWTRKGGTDGNQNVRALQVKLIIAEIGERGTAGDPVDFITLEQADKPLLQDDLQKAGLPGWTSLISQCQHDQIQLSYSADWQLASPAAQAAGCWQSGRPYHIAAFSNVKTGTELVYVIVHMPHIQCSSPIPPAAFETWHLPAFRENVAKVLRSGDPAKVDLIVSGDMNELGQCGNPPDFANVFGMFGTLTKSLNLDTCCDDNEFVSAFDHVVTNTGTISKTAIIADGAYPLDPGFNDRVCPPGAYCPRNEEHKAIYNLVTLPGR